MRRWLATAGLAAVGLAAVAALVPRGAAAQATATAASATASTFAALLDTLYAAVARGDTAALRARLAEDLEWTVGASGATIPRSALLGAAARLSAAAPRFVVDSVRVRPMGATALVDYRRDDHRTVGATPVVTRWRVLDVFARRDGRWLVVRHVQALRVEPATPVAADSAALQAFVGRYRIGPGYVDDVRWERGALVATVVGQREGARLVPVSSSAFVPDGVGALITFERDAAGRVVGYVQQYPDGRVSRATRLP